MTWFREPTGFELFFNRDERRARRPALPPVVRRKGSMRFLAALDGDFGGTWLAVNEAGLCLALLNGYTDVADESRAPLEGFTSRGLLVTELVDSRSGAETLERLGEIDVRRFRSFLLTTFDRTGTSRLATWVDGKLTIERDIDARMPLVSSSFETGEVCRTRHDLFRATPPRESVGRRERHFRYHASHLPERGPRSVCMHRPDAHTVSFTHVTVDADEARLHYTPHSPCKGLSPAPPICLPRPCMI